MKHIAFYFFMLLIQPLNSQDLEFKIELDKIMITSSASKLQIKGVVKNNGETEVKLLNYNDFSTFENPTSFWIINVEHDTTKMISPEGFFDCDRIPDKEDYLTLKSGASKIYYFEIDLKSFIKELNEMPNFTGNNQLFGQYNLQITYSGTAKPDQVPTCWRKLKSYNLPFADFNHNKLK